MPYVCSRTLTVKDIEKEPSLRNAIVLREDGTELWAYNNPMRRYGSLHASAWLEYVRERASRVAERPNAAALFFDNAFWPGADNSQASLRAWKNWAASRGFEPGKRVPSIDSGELTAASRMFSAESLTAFHGALQEICHDHDPLLLNSPNLGSVSRFGLMAAEAGVADLVFFETATHPPFVNNAFRYKTGLAVSHGKPTGMLAYLPEHIAAQRGQRTWHDGMHRHFYPSSPLAEEFSLAAAEAAACGATYVTNYSLFPSLPITDTTDPFCKRIHRAIKQSNIFIGTNEDLYADARPGSDVAVFYSTVSGIQGSHFQDGLRLGQALTDAGIPYDVICADDMTSGGMASFRTLILPNVQHVDDATAGAILQFARQGGRVIVTQAYGLRDPYGRNARLEAAQELLAPLNLVRRPVQTWQLEGFEPEGSSQIRVKSKPARASLQFDGPQGKYLAHISIIDENDGNASFSLVAGGRKVYEARLDVNDNRRHWHTTPAFELKPGNVLTLEAIPHAGERVRIQSVVLLTAAISGGVPIGHGRLFYMPFPLGQINPDERVALVQPEVQLSQPGKVFINVMDLPTRLLGSIHLVNYDFLYRVSQVGLYASDDGSGEARMSFRGQGVIVRKAIRIRNPGEVAQPVIELHGFATRDCTARLLIRINGQEAAIIRANEARPAGWIEAPIDRALLQKNNLVEVGAEGDLDGNRKWIQINIDTDTRTGDSWLSKDSGATFQAEDLSRDVDVQTGEYMIRIRDKAPGEVGRDPNNLARNPGFEVAEVRHAETSLTVVPAENVEVRIRTNELRECLAISPEGPPEWVTGSVRDGYTTYVVPSVRIYTMLLLGPSRAALRSVQEAQKLAAPWRLPPVTEPLRRSASAWRAYGDGYKLDAQSPRSGSLSIRCDNTNDLEVRGVLQQIDFEEPQPGSITVTAWSRCKDVSGQKNSDYAIYVDAVCADGTVFNGKNAPFDVGTHDWQKATLNLRPPGPIRRMKLHLLFRKHAGSAWFDDVKVTTNGAIGLEGERRLQVSGHSGPAADNRPRQKHSRK
jgi:hypothetical protein